MENLLMSKLLEELQKSLNKMVKWIYKKAIDRKYPWSIEQIVDFIEGSIMRGFEVEIKEPKCNQFLDIINVHDE